MDKKVILKPDPAWELDLRGVEDPARDNFRVQIFRLIAKADAGNLARLRLAWPLEVLIWEAWQSLEKDIFPAEIVAVATATDPGEVYRLASIYWRET